MHTLMQAMKALLFVGVVALPSFGTSSGASAADLSLRRPHRAVVHHRHTIRHHSQLVRDLDGTPILLRRVGEASTDAYGFSRLARYEAIPVRGATPSRYLNGQPVLPHCPRNWPRAFCSRG